MDKREMIINNPKLDGQVGESAVWNGPLSKKGFPMGKGSSSGYYRHGSVQISLWLQ